MLPWSPWNETTLGAVKGKVKFIQKYGTGVDSVDLKAAGKNGKFLWQIFRELMHRQ
ncbi:MAG: hypothetical protein ACLU3F_18790 [Blautia wexlerae]